MRSRPALLLLLFGFSTPACFLDACDEAPKPGSDQSGADFSFTYDLVEATGTWAVTGTRVQGTCTTTTTSSRLTVSLPQPDLRAASFRSSGGAFSASVDVDATLETITGTETCGVRQRACPESPRQPERLSAFFTFEAATPIPRAPQPGQAFISKLGSLWFPDLCDRAPYRVSDAALQGRPITVAELATGRFIIEGSGSTPLLPELPSFPNDPPPPPIDGQLTWTFRFVFQAPQYDPSKPFVAPVLPTYSECLTDVASTAASLEAAEAAFEGGATDLPLNPTGCRRLQLSREGETLTVRHEVTIGPKYEVDASGAPVASRNVLVPFVRTTDANGERDQFDADGDGFFEATDDTERRQGIWQGSVQRQYVPESMTLLRQVTRRRVDATTMQVQVEEGGRAADEFITPIRQTKCFDESTPDSPECADTPGGTPPTCGGTVAPCMGKELTDVKGKLAEALKKGTDCMKKNGFGAFDPEAKALTLVATKKLTFLCSSNPCDGYGYYEDGQLMVNTARTAGDAVELSKTLFHEMLHSDSRFSHNDRLLKRADKACKKSIVDRTFACEVMCFGPQASECTCNRCLTPDGQAPSKETCEKCKSFGACPGRTFVDAAGNTKNVSQGVGAYCKDGTFCDTLSECNAACGMLGVCKPFKSTCDEGCN